MDSKGETRCPAGTVLEACKGWKTVPRHRSAGSGSCGAELDDGPRLLLFRLRFDAAKSPTGTAK